MNDRRCLFLCRKCGARTEDPRGDLCIACFEGSEDGGEDLQWERVDPRVMKIVNSWHLNEGEREHLAAQIQELLGDVSRLSAPPLHVGDEQSVVEAARTLASLSHETRGELMAYLTNPTHALRQLQDKLAAGEGGRNEVIEAPYNCRECGKRFAREIDLVEHGDNAKCALQRLDAGESGAEATPENDEVCK